MFVCELTLQQFRCFKEFSIRFEYPIMVVVGANGTGKTTLCEALYYGCYARSFKTYTPVELVQFGASYSVLTMMFSNNSGLNTLSIGINAQKKMIKLNDQPVMRAKVLLQTFPVVMVCELDMQLITGGPGVRRVFLDQFLLLCDSEYVEILKKLRVILSQRNSLLQKNSMSGLKEWTYALWQQSLIIQKCRMSALHDIMQELNVVVHEQAFSYTVGASYEPHVALRETFDDFWQSNTTLFSQEWVQRRTLFGAHVDDILFLFNKNAARTFASRGQQKLSVILIKAAVVRLLQRYGKNPLFLIDDVMSDFDGPHLAAVTTFLKQLHCQLIITCTYQHAALMEPLSATDVQQIFLE